MMQQFRYGEVFVAVAQDGPWYVAYSEAVQGANGQGRTVEECLASWREAAELMAAWRADSR